MKPKAYADLADLSEADRIKVIARVAESGQIVAFIVEDQVKADRYKAQLAKYPNIQVIDQGPGPIPNSLTVRVGPKGH